MALVKSVAAVDAWTAVAANTIVEGATVDISACYEATLHIDAAITLGATASVNGLKAIIQIASATSGDINWTELTSFGMLSGITAVSDTISNTLTAGEASVISVSSLSGFTTEGQYLYLDDGASAEIVLMKSQSATGIAIVDNVTYGHAVGTKIYNGGTGATQSACTTIAVNIPDTAVRVRVIYDNTQDAAGPTYDVRCNISKVTSL